MILGDLGAEVIKIEKVEGGDDFRRLRPPVTEREGGPFLWCNRNKKSITIDLKSDTGRELFYELVRHSDIVLYNFSVGVAERLAIDYGAFSARNPRIISVSITGFGETAGAAITVHSLSD